MLSNCSRRHLRAPKDSSRDTVSKAEPADRIIEPKSFGQGSNLCSLWIFLSLKESSALGGNDALIPMEPTETVDIKQCIFIRLQATKLLLT